MIPLRFSHGLAIWLATGLVSSGSGQVIVNPGFETGTFEGWETLVGPPAYVEIDMNDPRVGEYCALVAAPGDPPGGAEVRQSFPPIPVRQIQSFFFYGAHVGFSGAQIVYSEDGAAQPITLSDAWTQVDVLSRLDRARSINGIVFYAYGPLLAGWIRFDEISLTLEPPCPGDVDDNHAVDLSDLATLLAHFGIGNRYPDGDLDGNGAVDVSDLAILLANFGATCP